MIRLLSNALPQGSLTSRPTLVTDTAGPSSPAVRARPPLAPAPHPAARRLALLARKALIAEAELTPKPGLVDRRGQWRPHRPVARPHAALGAGHRALLLPNGRGLERIRAMSVTARATCIHRPPGRARDAGSDRRKQRHKGAIWSLGLLISAAAMHDEDSRTPAANPTVAAPAAAPSPAGPAACAALAATAKDIASFQDRAMPRLVSHGDAVARRYNVTGARGEALSGFPHVMKVALPILRRKREDGVPAQIARLDALIGIMSRLDDTCVLHRGGEAALTATKEGALAVEAAGGTGTPLGRQRLLELDRRLLALNASPGGSADLLAAALFLDALEQRQRDVAADQSLAEAPDGTH